MDGQRTNRSRRQTATITFVALSAITAAIIPPVFAQESPPSLRYLDAVVPATVESDDATTRQPVSPGGSEASENTPPTVPTRPKTAIDVNASATTIVDFLQNFDLETYSVDDMIAVAGKPVAEKTTLEGETHIFRSESFSSLAAISVREKIIRIKGEFAKAQPLEQFREDWSLTEIAGAIVPDSRANPIGQAYPELGLVVYFKLNAPRPLVTHFDLRPLAAQPFLWRVQHGYSYNYADRFADLDRATRIDPRNNDIHWIRAELLLELERPAEALREIEAALQTSVASPRYRLTKGRALIGQGLPAEAIAEFRSVAEAEGVSKMDRAAAETAWGDVIAMGENANYPAAMQHHQKAIEYAGQASREMGPLAARTIQSVMVDAHFGGARAVAMGPWKGGDAAARQWLIKANTFAKILVDREKGDPTTAIEAHRRSIEVLEKLSDESNVADLVALAEKEGELLLSATTDEMARKRLEWELAQIYFRAARMLRKQGKMAAVTKYYSKAYEWIRQQEDERETTPSFNYFLGNVHFFAGSLYAVNQEDHAKAMPIYQRALTYYSRTLGPGMQAESGLQGERYVSMGVTFWQSGERDQAVALSAAGLQLMEQAARRNEMPRSELAVPYNNLAHMKSEMGEAAEALKYQRIATEITAAKSR